jgi:hypothetical protein
MFQARKRCMSVVVENKAPAPLKAGHVGMFSFPARL